MFMYKTLLFLSLLFVCSNLSAQTKNDNTVTDSVKKEMIDSSALYGFIPERPIKVGGGPAEQKQYLERLRDAQGKKISYTRSGSCCSYETNSRKALFGGGMLDIYQITYRNSENKKQKVDVYITFYDFEEPRSLKGFVLVE